MGPTASKCGLYHPLNQENLCFGYTVTSISMWRDSCKCELIRLVFHTVTGVSARTLSALCQGAVVWEFHLVLKYRTIISQGCQIQVQREPRWEMRSSPRPRYTSTGTISLHMYVSAAFSPTVWWGWSPQPVHIEYISLCDIYSRNIMCSHCSSRGRLQTVSSQHSVSQTFIQQLLLVCGL